MQNGWSQLLFHGVTTGWAGGYGICWPGSVAAGAARGEARIEARVELEMV